MNPNESEILTTSEVVERVFIDNVDSTNNYAMKMLRDKEKSGKPFNNFYVVTEDQKLGKGQRGNRWSSNKGQDLAMSSKLSSELISPMLGPCVVRVPIIPMRFHDTKLSLLC